MSARLFTALVIIASVAVLAGTITAGVLLSRADAAAVRSCSVEMPCAVLFDGRMLETTR